MSRKWEDKYNSTFCSFLFSLDHHTDNNTHTHIHYTRTLSLPPSPSQSFSLSISLSTSIARPVDNFKQHESYCFSTSTTTSTPTTTSTTFTPTVTVTATVTPPAPHYSLVGWGGLRSRRLGRQQWRRGCSLRARSFSVVYARSRSDFSRCCCRHSSLPGKASNSVSSRSPSRLVNLEGGGGGDDGDVCK
jgi:hypothetical protein